MQSIKNTLLVLIAVLICVTFLTGIQANAGGKDFFDVMELLPGGKVRLCFKVDIDLDGSDEIACIYSKGKYPQSELSLKTYKFKRTKNNKFEAVELFSFLLDKKFVLLDYAKPHGIQRNAFYAMAADGIYELDYFNGKLSTRHIVRKDMLVGSAEYEDISYVDFVRDYDSDGFIEILGFEKKGYSFWEYDDKGSFYEKTFFNIKPKFYYNSSYGDNPFWKKFNFRGVYWTQEIMLRDFDGDGNQDILFFWEDELDVCWGDAKNGFNDKNHNSFWLKEISENDRDEKDAYVTYYVDDLNQDGLPDLVMNKFKGAFTSHISDTKIIFRNNPRGVEGKEMRFKPDEGDWEGGIAKDIDADGKKDFVLITGNFGVFAIIKAVMKGKIDIKFSFHHFKDGIIYSKKSDYSRKISMGFSLRKADMIGILPNLDFDFNADGLPDVFYSTTTDEIRIILGRKNKRYSLNKVEKFKTDISRSYILCDIDGDKKTDVVFYNKKGNAKEKIRVLGNMF